MSKFYPRDVWDTYVTAFVLVNRGVDAPRVREFMSAYNPSHPDETCRRVFMMICNHSFLPNANQTLEECLQRLRPT
jgi:hypothetical protein